MNETEFLHRLFKLVQFFLTWNYSILTLIIIILFLRNRRLKASKIFKFKITAYNLN